MTKPTRRTAAGPRDAAWFRFNNDTTPRCDEKTAALAWGRTIDFFNGTLRG